MDQICYEDFCRLDLRIGTVCKVEPFDKAKKPAYKIWVDFGQEIGILHTSAQVTKNYTPLSLIGKRVVGCVNLGEKNIAGFISQFLLCGFSGSDAGIVLATIDQDFESVTPNGARLH